MTEAIREFLAAEQTKGYPMVLIDDVLALLAPAGRLTDTTDPTELLDELTVLAAGRIQGSGPASWSARVVLKARAEIESLRAQLGDAEQRMIHADRADLNHALAEVDKQRARADAAESQLAAARRTEAWQTRHSIIARANARAAALLAQPERICAAEIWGPLQPANLSKICQLPAGHAGEHLHRPALAQPETPEPAERTGPSELPSTP